MGRFGRLPVELPEQVKAEILDGKVVISGPKGSLQVMLARGIEVDTEDNGLVVKKRGESKHRRAMQGTIRSHLANVVQGVSGGWQKQLEINGPGYRAEMRGDELHLSVGKSHPVVVRPPQGIKFMVEKNIITVEGIDRQLVGQVAAVVREKRKVNVYVGSGISYVGEQVRRKAGKQAAGGE